MDPISLLLALSVFPAPQVTVAPASPSAGDPVRVLATGLTPGRIYAVRAFPIGEVRSTDCTERRAVAVRADRDGRLRAVLDPSWQAGPHRRTAHDIADGWCPQSYRVTVTRGGERHPVARTTFRVTTQRYVA